MSVRSVKKSHILSGVLSLILMITGAGSAAAAAGGTVQTASPASYKIVALGDSITAGFEPAMITQTNPKAYGYVDRLHEQGLFRGRTQTVNYGILGLKSEGLGHYVKAIKEGRTLAPDEIQPALADPRAAAFGQATAAAKADLLGASVIVITIGGNDVSQVMTAVAEGKVTSGSLEASVAQLLGSYKTHVSQTLTDLTELNPNAQIVIADQYQPVPKLAGAAAYEQLEQTAEAFTESVDQLAEEFTAKGAKVKVAHVAKEFVGGEISYTHIMEKDIHPNQFGYEVIAKVFAKEIWGEYLYASTRSSEVPLTIIVKGKEISSPYKPVVKNGQTFVAIKDIVTAIGATTAWDNRTNSATISSGSRKVVIPVGSKTIKVNGHNVATASPAYLNKIGKETKTYVPLALLAQGLGLDVQYSSHLKVVFINP
ncbi:stalk domain-containing protein [Paenibacillus sp. YPG26]|uniref:stalk domain-containing protein n=1 Tax=Paenibacillus sp. YPG26 TaxID=2878915 RepID=UPI0020423E84|nr:stalk domain-containing protein [Paenibacillus sp. YPG26]USB33847.1 GDSL-type esterase/lipase family protein [Paenibacillus sp. YPG26]